jgi:hypothetical protein
MEIKSIPSNGEFYLCLNANGEEKDENKIKGKIIGLITDKDTTLKGYLVKGRRKKMSAI